VLVTVVAAEDARRRHRHNQVKPSIDIERPADAKRRFRVAMFDDGSAAAEREAELEPRLPPDLARGATIAGC
jgi:hypothetical protein